MPGAHAPTSVSWGYENRTAAIRIPGGDHHRERVFDEPRQFAAGLGNRHRRLSQGCRCADHLLQTAANHVGRMQDAGIA
uniref:hypothetical protein n=1 Tax=Marinobacter psychrophilus TaxID=330734 RepID=UPI001D0D76B6|nr:hypothetical protein [Marinobacter psychrophilus]